MKFKSDIEVQAGLKDSSGSNGLSGQVLSSNGTTVSWINAGGSFAETVKNQVKAGVAINKGQAVYETGADGTNIVVGLASNASEATSSKTLGLLDATVAINGFANVVQIGKLSGLNTSGATAGDPVWLGVNGNLIYGLANKPYAPKHLVFIGVVTRVNANNGEIFVNVQNGFELNEIHDVDLITNVPINGDILGFNGTLWVNKTIAGWLGYTPANDANVVHNTGNETISGVKTFSNNIIGNAFVKAGGTVDQYLKADGSVSTAMNSRVEVNFIATSGQTTFTTPYEVGQVEVYYNGSKLYPDEFVATNGTSVVLVTPATLNAQISIVKFVSSFNTTSIRTESVFTTTGGQTTFSVNYAPGQVDVFYNGSKLSPAEFTATNGTSVVLGFACAAGESIVIDSFVNQVSGANGTANRVSKFTGVASLSDSQIDDNGTNVSIGYDINPDTYKLDVAGTGKFDGALLADSFATLSGTSSQFLKANGSVDSTSYLPRTGGTLTGALNGTRASFTQTSATDTLYGFNGYAGGIGLTGGAHDGTGGYFVNNSTAYPVVKLLGISPTLLIEGSNNSGVKFTVSTTGNIYTAGNVLIGTSTDAGYKLDVNGTGRFTNNLYVNTRVILPNMSIGYWDGANSRIESGSDRPLLITAYSQPINMGISGGTQFTIADTGRVGVHVTNPSSKLQIDATSWSYNGSNVSRMLQKYIGGAGDYVQHVILLHPIYNGTLIAYNKCSGTIYATRGGTSMGLINDTYTLDTAAAYNAVSGSVNSTNGYGRLYTCLYNGVKYMALLPDYRTSAVEYNFDGYSKSTGEQLTLVNYRMSNSGTVLNSEINNSLTVFTPTTSYYQGVLYTTSDLYADGNCGIGTTTPGAKLNVRGSLGSVVGAGGSAIRLTNSDTGAWASISAGVVGVTNEGMQLSTEGVSRLVISSAGNVLIGTTTDAGYKLDVEGYLAVKSGGYGGGGIVIKSYANGSSRSWGIFNDQYLFGDFCINTSSTQSGSPGTTRVYISPSGNVGVGTYVPDAKFHLRGASSFNRLTQMSPTGASSDAVNLIASTNPSGSDQWWSWGVSNDDSYRIVKGTDLSGTGVKVTVGSTSWTSSSDIRIKNVVGKVENALEKINTLSPIFYELKDDKLKTKRVGLIAQEVYEVLPESVDKPIKEEDIWGVRYTEIIPLLVAAIQELKAEIEILKNK